MRTAKFIFTRAPVLVVLLISCAHVPPENAPPARDVLDRVVAKSRALLETHIAAVSELHAREKKETATRLTYPTAFDPDAEDDGKKADPFIQSFSNAILALELYADGVRAISENRAEVHTSRNAAIASTVAATADRAVGLPVAEAVTALIDYIANAHDRAQLKKALISGAPLATELLDALVQATPDLYRVRAGVSGEKMSNLAFEQQSVIAEMEHIAAEFAPPPPGTPESLDRARLESEWSELHQFLFPDTSPRPLPAGSRPFDATAQQRLQQQLQVLRHLHEQRVALAEEITAYHAELREYVALIAATKRELQLMEFKSK